MVIIAGVERRCRSRLDEELRIVAELERPRASFAEVARRHDVSRRMVWNWRRQVRNGKLTPSEAAQFLPVQVRWRPRVCGAAQTNRGDRHHDRDRAAGRHHGQGGCGW